MTPTVWQVGERFRGWRLDRFLTEQIPKLSRRRIQEAIRSRIELSWRGSAKPATRMRVGGEVIASFPRLFEIPTEYRFEVLYEDADLLAVNKPAGLAVHPTNSARANTLIEAIRRERGDDSLFLVHRLDRETSGVLLLARSRNVARRIGRLFMARTVSKTYLARVRGTLPADEGEIDLSLGKHPTSRVFVRRAVVAEGELARTHYRRLKQEEGTSLVRLTPQTGRRHQLRVHMEAIGCPIVGDPLYGQPDEHYLSAIRGEATFGRLHLHSESLTLPTGGVEPLRIQAPNPDWLT